MILIGILAAAAFCTAVCAFGLTVVGIDALRVTPDLMWLHGAVMVLWLPFLISASREFSRHQAAGGHANVFEVIYLDCPSWAAKFHVILVLITAFCAVTMLITGQGGQVAIEHGRYVLEYKGRPFLEIPIAQYNVQLMREHLTFISMWMTFLFFPVSQFLLRQPKLMK